MLFRGKARQHALGHQVCSAIPKETAHGPGCPVSPALPASGQERWVAASTARPTRGRPAARRYIVPRLKIWATTHRNAAPRPIPRSRKEKKVALALPQRDGCTLAMLTPWATGVTEPCPRP